MSMNALFIVSIAVSGPKAYSTRAYIVQALQVSDLRSGLKQTIMSLMLHVYHDTRLTYFSIAGSTRQGPRADYALIVCIPIIS